MKQQAIINIAGQLGYNRQFFVKGVDIVNNSLLMAAGTVKNTGRLAWDNTLEPKARNFRIGIRIYNPVDLIGPVLEERYYFDEQRIDPGQCLDFNLCINIAKLPLREYLLKLNIVKEFCYWFDDLGAPSEVIRFEKNNVKNYDRKFYFSAPLKIKEKIFLKLSGKLQNCGKLAWINVNRLPYGHFRIGAAIYDEPNFRKAVREARYDFTKKTIEPGEFVNFDFLVHIGKFPPGQYFLKINVLKESQFWFDDIGISPELFEFKIEKEAYYDRKFYFQSTGILIRNRLLDICGKVENTGNLPWDNRREQGNKTFGIGAAVFREGQSRPALIEGRFIFKQKLIKQGDYVKFHLKIGVLGLPKGRYIAKINVLQEDSFWLDAVGVPSEIIKFEVADESSLGKSKVKYCKNPSETRILFSAPTLPLFDRESGGNRIFEMLKLLRKKKYKVTFLCEKIKPSHEKYLKELKKIGISCFEGPLNFLAGLKGNEFNICILSWYLHAEKLIEAVRRAVPYVKIIVDSVDVHWKREERGIKSGLLAVTAGEAKKHKAKEVKVYEQADIVWAVTEEDRVAILAQIPDCKVKIISNIHRRYKSCLKEPNGNGVIFVGNFNHPPNESAALWGYEICKKFREKTGFEFTYFIAGNNPSRSLKSLHNGKDTIVTGYVRDLFAYYKKSRIMLAPLKFGAGIKGKICHSICSGLPVITTDIGNEGIGLEHGKEAFIANTTEEFIENLHLVFSGHIDLKSLNERALQKVLNITHENNALKTIEPSLYCKHIVIAIVSYNRKDLLKRCLDSIMDKTRYPNYKIAVVSNGCKDGTKELLLEYAKKHKAAIDAYFNQENEFFVKPNNFMINKYPKSDIVLMNNDVEVLSENWLMSLYDAAYISDRVGAAGGKILDQQGLISEAGAELYNDGRGKNIGRGDCPDRKEHNIQKYAGYVSGCLLYLRRDMIDKFGALDEDFSPMYYEDAEWQYRLHKNGIFTVYTPDCVVIHREGSSAGTDITSGMKRYQEINRLKFIDKFKGVDIEKYNTNNGY